MKAKILNRKKKDLKEYRSCKSSKVYKIILKINLLKKNKISREIIYPQLSYPNHNWLIKKAKIKPKKRK